MATAYFRAISSLVFALFFAFPTYAHAAIDPGVTVAQATGAISGAVADGSGAPVSNAFVVLRGAQTYTTRTDETGAFTLPNIAPGIYSLSITKPGYTAAVQSGLVILGGQSLQLAVRMDVTTFSSLRTIATVHAIGQGALNTSTAAINVVSAQSFVDQAQPQITRVLNQVPGVQISLPGQSANGATPGSITVPNIRAAASYETATLIDGHPLAVSSFGDYVTTFLNSFMLGNTEVIKGPGADAPEVNDAIGGTINFRTKDPTLTAEPTVLFGVTSRGGTYTNFGFSDTIANRLGLVVAVATTNLPSALDGTSVVFDPSGGFLNNDFSNSLAGNATFTTVGNTASSIQTGYSLLSCCYTLRGFLDSTSELIKFHYKFSPNTTATVSYLGSQAFSDQNANTGNLTNADFIPTDPAYHGSLKPGPVPVSFIFPGGFDGETNNEPMFQGEIGTTVGKDTILARYYHASIDRLQYEGDTPDSLGSPLLTLFGNSTNGQPTFNGDVANVGFSNYFRETEEDKLAGWSFEYNHSIGADLITLSVDQTNTQSTLYELFPTFNSVTLPQGSSQIFTTYLARGHFYFGPKIEATIADYFNVYRSTYPATCPFSFGFSNCSIDGTGVGFVTTSANHNDPRLGAVYRPNSSTSIRFAMGSAIAPPYLALLSLITNPIPEYNSANLLAITTKNAGQLKPETAWGYNLGADVRLKDAVTIVSGDFYLTNLFNHFFGQTVPTGLVCTGVGAASSCAPDPNTTLPAPPGTPIFAQTNTNISNFRFEGIELSVRHSPALGFGYNVSGALQKGYVYNLPPFFYCSIPVTGCTQDQNLNIVANENLNGEGVGFGSTIGSLNTRIPYAQGNGELSYTLKNGALALFGDTYYGNNNALNQKPFGIAYFTVRYPITKGVEFQVSGDNVFNAYNGLIPIFGGGLPIPLANGQTAATTANVLGPATYSFVLTTRLP